MHDALGATIQRIDFLDWYRRNRRRSAGLFDSIDHDAYLSRPIPLRHPVVFYEGHLPAFSFITLARDTFGMPSVDAKLEKLFQRGIDPADAAAAEAQSISAWPPREDILAFGRACDDAVIACLERAALEPLHSRPQMAAYTILEHEQMHHETLLYIFHRIPLGSKRDPEGLRPSPDGTAPSHEVVRVEAGTATLGVDLRDVPFGWDNEVPEMQVDVPAFSIDAHSVTNGDYLAFVKAGGPVPTFWIDDGGGFSQLTMFARRPLPLAWPVYVTLDQAMAYAAWAGKRLPTEAEYHRAAYGAPNGGERDQPWGNASSDGAIANLDFARWDPEPAGSRPAGASAWGIHDLVGNGWEWTASTFEPFPGFSPMATYPQYSADFFDGDHYVVKGASPVTARELVRRSFRNWYRPNYPYIYAKFRCVS